MINFSKHQSLIFTNKCNLRCPGCIVPDKNLSYNTSFYNEKLILLLEENEVEKIRISGGEAFLEYEKLKSFLEKLRKFNIDFSEIFTNGLLEQNGNTNNFLEFLSKNSFNPIFNLSIDEIHQDTIDTNIKLIKKLVNFETPKIVINSSNFTKQEGNNIKLFRQELEKLGAILEQKGGLYYKYKLENTEIVINIKGMYKIDNFEKNILDIPNSFWNFSFILDKTIKSIGYNSLAYTEEVFAYMGIDFGFILEEKQNKIIVGEFQNQELYDFITQNPLINLFGKIKKQYPEIKQEYFNTQEEFIFYILKNKLLINKII